MPPAGSTISIPTKLLATGVACALAVVVCGTAASVMVSSEVTTKLALRGKARRATSALQLSTNALGDTFRDTGPVALAIDSLLKPLGTRTPANPLDVGLLTSLNNSGSSPNPVWEVPLAVRSPGALPKAPSRRPGAKFSVDSLDAGWAARVVADAGNGWLPIFRRWARSERLPALWGYRTGMPGVEDARGWLPIRAHGAFRTLFSANEDAAMLAFLIGHYDTAKEHALENIAASRHFIEQPILIDAMVGRMQLQRGLQLLAAVAKRSGDNGTASLALYVDSAARRFDLGGAVHALYLQEADPDSHAAEDVVANRKVHPALRVEAISTILLGGCRNTPELVFGFSSKRRDAFERAAASLLDIDRGSELAASRQRFLEYALSNVRADTPARESLLQRNDLMKTFAWIVPPGVRARSALCLEQAL